jgi:G3E family GTPase
MALRPASEVPVRVSAAGRRDHRLFRLRQDDPAPVLQTFATHRALGCELHLRALICVVDEANFERMPEGQKAGWRSPNIADPVVVHFDQHVAHPPVELEDWTDDDRRSRLLFVNRGLARKPVVQPFALIAAFAAG